MRKWYVWGHTPGLTAGIDFTVVAENQPLAGYNYGENRWQSNMANVLSFLEECQPPLEDAVNLFDWARGDFDMETLGELAKKGDDLIRTAGNLHRAICEVQEPLFRTLQPQREFVMKHSHLFPNRAPGMIEVLANGVVGNYKGDMTCPYRPAPVVSLIGPMTPAVLN